MYLFSNPILVHHEPAVYDAIAQHSFGWVDGISAAICPYLATSMFSLSYLSGCGLPPLWPPISILVRGETDDPWARDTHSLELNTLFPNPDYYYDQKLQVAEIVPSGPEDMKHPPPYIFPPQKSYLVKSRRGPLRCRQIRLGKYGTAMWLEPQERSSLGLVTPISDEQWRWQHENMVQRNESLRVGVFPGSLSSCGKAYSQVLEDIAGTDLVENEANNWTSFDYDEIGGRIVVASSIGNILAVSL